MKQFIALLVASFALAFSALARAEMAPKQESIAFDVAAVDEANFAIVLRGELPNPCVVAPTPTLALSGKDGVITLSVTAVRKPGLCMQIPGGEFELAFDIRSMKYELLRLGLDANSTYKIVTTDGSLNLDVDFSRWNYTLPFSSISKIGVLVPVEGGDAELQTQDGEIYRIKSPVIDVTEFAGSKVVVLGHKERAQVPGLELKMGNVSTKSILLTGLHTTEY